MLPTEQTGLEAETSEYSISHPGAGIQICCHQNVIACRRCRLRLVLSREMDLGHRNRQTSHQSRARRPSRCHHYHRCQDHFRRRALRLHD